MCGNLRIFYPHYNSSQNQPIMSKKYISASVFNESQFEIIYGDSIIYSGSNFVYSINCKCFPQKTVKKLLMGVLNMIKFDIFTSLPEGYLDNFIDFKF